jgi:RHS repeat-associated protein
MICNNLTSMDNLSITFNHKALGMPSEGGQGLSYTYDTLGRLINIQQNTNTFTYGYTGFNPLVQSLTRPNGTFTEYLYNDPLKRLTDISNKTSADAIINKHVFTYNNLDLIGTETVTTSTPLDSFTAGFKTYDYNKVNQLLTSTNPAESFTYDDDGNMTQGYTPEGYQFTATYDAENRLALLSYNDGSVNHETKYFYSGDSMLAKIEKYENIVKVDEKRFIRTGFLAIQDRDGSNAGTRDYMWGQDLGGGIGGLLNLKQNGQDYFYLYDGKGNVSTLIDGSQNIVASYRYDVFGKLLKKTGTLDQPFRFSTKQYDEQTGLYDFGYRFNNPVIGRWMTRDPLGEAGGINFYGFVGNNPVNFVDPLGLDWFRPKSDIYVVGRMGNSFVAPGKGIGKFIDDYVPAGHTFGSLHDALVDMGLEAGLPDWLINIPTMPGVYVLAVGTEIDNSLYEIFQKEPLFVCH